MRNKNVDMLRGLLILMIMFYHYTFRFSEIYGYKTIEFWSLKDWGTIGVGCFFIISGYFLIPKKGFKNINLSWLKQKFLRLFPLYFITITITFLITNLLGLPGKEVSFFEYLLNIPFINGIINTPYVDGAHWYLTYLIIFYILFYLMSCLVKFKKNLNADKMLLMLLLINLVFKFLNISFIYKLLGGDYLVFILIGIFIKKDLQGKLFYLHIFLFLLLVYFNFGMVVCGFIIAFILMFSFIINIKEDLTRNNPLYFVGEISYPIYLLHQNLGYVLLFNFMKLNNAYKHYLIILVIVFIVIIFISKWLSLIYEKLGFRFSYSLERKKLYDKTYFKKNRENKR